MFHSGLDFCLDAEPFDDVEFAQIIAVEQVACLDAKQGPQHDPPIKAKGPESPRNTPGIGHGGADFIFTQTRYGERRLRKCLT